MKIRDYIDQLPEKTPCEKDCRTQERHLAVSKVFLEERDREYEPAAAVPAAFIDPLF